MPKAFIFSTDEIEDVSADANRWEDLAGTEDDTTSLQERFSDLLPLIPPVEADLLLLHAEGKRQQDIATIFGVTQAAISYRLDRAKRRLRWLASRPPKPISFARDIADVAKRRPHAFRHFEREQERVRAYIRFFQVLDETSSQRQAYERAGVDQGVCNNTIKLTKKLLKELGRLETLARLKHLEGHYGVLCEQHRSEHGKAFQHFGKLSEKLEDEGIGGGSIL